MLDDLLKAFSHKQSRSWRPKHGHHHRDHDFGAILGVLRTVAGNKAMLAGLVVSSLVVLALGAWLLVSLVSTSGPISTSSTETASEVSSRRPKHSHRGCGKGRASEEELLRRNQGRRAPT